MRFADVPLRRYTLFPVLDRSPAPMPTDRATLPLDDLAGTLRPGGTVLSGDSVAAYALRLAHAATERGETCIYVSASETLALAERAAVFGFDVGAASRDGLFRLLPPPAPLQAGDEACTQALADLTTVVRRRRPAHLIIEDAAPLACFDDTAWFDAAFAAMHDRLAEVGTTLTLGVTPSDDATLDRLRTHVLQIVPVPDPVEVSGDGSAYQISPMLAPQGDAPEDRKVALDSTPTPPAAASAPDGLPSGIDYLDLTVAPRPSAPERDPFATPSEPYTLGRGHYVAADITLQTDSAHPHTRLDHLDRALLGGTTVEARSDLASASSAAAVPTDELFETVDVKRTLRAFEARPKPVRTAPPPEPPPSPRIVFVQAFNAALELHAAADEPFLALALQMPPEHPASRRFHFVIGGLRQAVGERGYVLADERRCRVVALLPGRNADAAQELFREVKAHLRAATDAADHTLSHVKALVVPDGKPFPNATEFLAHVFD